MREKVEAVLWLSSKGACCRLVMSARAKALNVVGVFIV